MSVPELRAKGAGLDWSCADAAPRGAAAARGPRVDVHGPGRGERAAAGPGNNPNGPMSNRSLIGLSISELRIRVVATFCFGLGDNMDLQSRRIQFVVRLMYAHHLFTPVKAGSVTETAKATRLYLILKNS